MILMGKSMVSGFDFPLNQSIDSYEPRFAWLQLHFLGNS